VGLPCAGVLGVDDRRQARPGGRRTGEVILLEGSSFDSTMITIPGLQTALLDLLHEVQGTDIKLTTGGGFGIYLKADHVRSPRILRIGQGLKDG